MFSDIDNHCGKSRTLFLKLKLIKNYLGNSCGQERSSGTVILNIEKERTKTLNIEKIIDNFVNSKSRIKNFLKYNAFKFTFVVSK